MVSGSSEPCDGSSGLRSRRRSGPESAHRPRICNSREPALAFRDRPGTDRRRAARPAAPARRSGDVCIVRASGTSMQTSARISARSCGTTSRSRAYLLAEMPRIDRESFRAAWGALERTTAWLIRRASPALRGSLWGERTAGRIGRRVARRRWCLAPSWWRSTAQVTCSTSTAPRRSTSSCGPRCAQASARRRPADRCTPAEPRGGRTRGDPVAAAQTGPPICARAPPAGFEPATHGLGNRCSIP